MTIIAGCLPGTSKAISFYYFCVHFCRVLHSLDNETSYI